jgi:hypothetical protein
MMVNECVGPDVKNLINNMDKLIDRIVAKGNVRAPDVLEGGGLSPFSSMIDQYQFYRVLCINYMILSNRYTEEEKKRPDEMDIFGANIPFLGTILADFMERNLPFESFLTFFLLSMYLAGQGEKPIREIQQALCPKSPFFYHFPELVHEFVSLTFGPSEFEKLIRIAENYEVIVQLLQLKLPELPVISTATFAKTDKAIDTLYVLSGTRRDQLIQKNTLTLQKSLVESSKIHAPLRLVSGKQSIVISATAGGAKPKPKKTRRSTRKSNRRTRKHRRSK